MTSCYLKSKSLRVTLAGPGKNIQEQWLWKRRSITWLPLEGNFALSTLFYAEYNNKGSGSDVKSRVKWPGFKVIKKDDAL